MEIRSVFGAICALYPLVVSLMIEGANVQASGSQFWDVNRWVRCWLKSELAPQPWASIQSDDCFRA